MGVVLQDSELRDVLSLSSECMLFHIICIFGVTSICMKSDILPYKTIQAIT